MKKVIPPILEKRIEENVEPARKFRARKARLLSEKTRKKREEMPSAFEPGVGEVRQVSDGQNQEKTDGPVLRVEDSPDVPGDLAANRIYDADGTAFAFYHTIFGRNGPSGDGRKMRSIVRFGDQWDNEAYDGEFVLVGEGDIFPPMHKSRGVTYHERGHEFTAAANGLRYSKWPGHLNEAGSDIICFMTEQWDLQQLPKAASWLLAPELFTEGLQGRALRDGLRKRRGLAFDDSILGPDPQFVDMDDFVEHSDPHLGSSIPNGAFAEACIFHGNYSWLEIGHIWYDVWTRMTPITTGPEYARMTVDLATERFGVNSKEREAWVYGWDWVKLAWQSSPNPNPVPPDPSVCDEFLRLVANPKIRALAAAVAEEPEFRRALAALRKFQG
jgi:Zn-dependent metalloprotease